MENETVGKIVVTAKLENLEDLFDVERGNMTAEEVRSIEVDNALVDTGAMLLSLPSRLIDQLGVKRRRKRQVRTSGGVSQTWMCNAVRLTVQDRDCTVDVAEVPDDCPVLIGQVPLEILDFVVDPVNQKLIGNPEHGGEQMIELL